MFSQKKHESEMLIVYCNKCGTKLLDDEMFCAKCGSAVIRSENAPKTVKRECKSCGAQMVMNDDLSGYHCIYCGSVETIAEYEQMAIENINAKAKHELEMERAKKNHELSKARQEYTLDRQYRQTQKEIELEQMHQQARKERLSAKISEAEKERKENLYFDGIFFRLAVTFSVIAVLVTVLGFVMNKPYVISIGVAQIILFGLSILFGFRVLGNIMYKFHAVLVILGLILTPVWMTLMFQSSL